MQTITQTTRCQQPVGRGRCTHEAVEGEAFCEAHMPAVVAVEPEPVAVEPVETPAPADAEPEVEFKRCGCGCGRIVNRKREFAQGHDSKRKSALLRGFDAGDEEAAVELMSRGWYSNDDLQDRAEKREAKEARAAARAEAKAAKAAKAQAN